MNYGIKETPPQRRGHGYLEAGRSWVKFLKKGHWLLLLLGLRFFHRDNIHPFSSSLSDFMAFRIAGHHPRVKILKQTSNAEGSRASCVPWKTEWLSGTPKHVSGNNTSLTAPVWKSELLSIPNSYCLLRIRSSSDTKPQPWALSGNSMETTETHVYRPRRTSHPQEDQADLEDDSQSPTGPPSPFPVSQSETTGKQNPKQRLPFSSNLRQQETHVLFYLRQLEKESDSVKQQF